MFFTSSSSPNFIPNRIISLVPSQTELLSYLGLENETVGITKFCVHPTDWFRSKPRIGGTKNINLQKIISLQPDLILCNKEENVKEQVEELATLFPVYLSDVSSFADAIEMITEVGKLTEKKDEANFLTKKINANFDALQKPPQSIRTAYLIWNNPYMTIGGDTFISDMMAKAGFDNVFKNENRYPEINIQQLKHHRPEVVLLSTEPYPFKQKHIDDLQTHLPGIKTLLADGEMFSWYGSRMLKAPEYFQYLHSLCSSV